MTLFLRRLLFHMTAAADVLAILLLIGEAFAPGSILPFIDAIDFLLPLIVLNVATGLLSGRRP